MRILQHYNATAVTSDMIARGWRIAELHRAANAVRAADGQGLPPLSYDAVARFLRGESHSPITATAIASALGKTEVAYRMKDKGKAARARA